MSLLGKSHQATLDLNADVEGHQEVQTAWLAVVGEHVTNSKESR